MDAKIPFSTFDPSLPMSTYEGYNMTDNPFGESAPNGAPREFLPNWHDFLYDQGMGALDTSDLPPLPLLDQGQSPSFLGNDRALPLYNTGTQFPFPNQDNTDLALSPCCLAHKESVALMDQWRRPSQMEPPRR